MHIPTISNSATFEEAISFTQSLLEAMESQQISFPDTQKAIASLVQFPNGARGFFVTYLTVDSTLPDNPSPEVIDALATSPEIVGDLLVKNLAMSSAMVITHLRNHNPDLAESSRRVTRRTQQLIKLLNLPNISELLAQLEESVKTNSGKYQDFFTKWGYDQEQLEAIAQALEFK